MTIGMKKLSSKTLKKVYNRHYQLLGCFNYERQMSTGYAWTMMPAIRELYGEDEAKMKAGVKRHLEFFNCATTPSPFIIGITCAMEEQCASAPDGEFDVASINSVKAALMGPLAGIGDSFFWGTFRVIGVGVGAVIHNWIPEAWIEALLGTKNPLGVVLATLVGVPMYADIFGTIPVAEALLAKGAQLGTILAFMMAVTTLSLPSMIMLKKAVKPKLLAVFIAVCTIGIILVGYLFNGFQGFLI